MLRRKRNSLTSANCALRDEKEAIWAKGQSVNVALEGEQLDECQLPAEGRERRSYPGERIVGLCCVGTGTA
jgi:hypothetical protein